MHSCKVCGKSDEMKPMCFKGEQWCCELHRKVVMGELESCDVSRHRLNVK